MSYGCSSTQPRLPQKCSRRWISSWKVSIEKILTARSAAREDDRQCHRERTDGERHPGAEAHVRRDALVPLGGYLELSLDELRQFVEHACIRANRRGDAAVRGREQHAPGLERAHP